MNSIHRTVLLVLILLYPAGTALAQGAKALEPPTVPSRAVPGTHDCADFFPEAARRDNESGDVRVTYDVGADGTISNVRVVKSSGYNLLDRAAVACVSAAWRNTPAERGGIKIASPGHQAIIRFALTEPPPAPTTPAPAPEESDLPLLIGGAGLILVVIGGGAVLLYRRRRPGKAGSPTLGAVGRDEEH